MVLDVGYRFLLAVLFCLIQALVLNHIRLFNCATPLLYVYFILLFPRGYHKSGILAWSFLVGIAIDIFSNTAGVASASMTFVGAVQPYLLEVFLPKESPENLKPSMRTLGVFSFVLYAFVLVLIYMVIFFSLEAFNFFNPIQWIESIGGSLALTLLLIFVLEYVRKG